METACCNYGDCTLDYLMSPGQQPAGRSTPLSRKGGVTAGAMSGPVCCGSRKGLSVETTELPDPSQDKAQ